ncbi:unnamed protein product [Psylliodes chrysocephalus]|uniref:Uncharacterized protein n=1 Tax=Psylliodes chrysocephalus TaxID=3402493 RepID=A0A9P0DCA0_9CUCU|nr:unnamed protein product [Psylliodes chrysocephala]
MYHRIISRNHEQTLLLLGYTTISCFFATSICIHKFFKGQMFLGAGLPLHPCFYMVNDITHLFLNEVRTCPRSMELWRIAFLSFWVIEPSLKHLSVAWVPYRFFILSLAI